MASDEDFEDEQDGIPFLRQLVEVQRDTAMAVATGSPMDTHRSIYSQQRTKLRAALQTRGLDDPFPWPSIDVVWSWAKHWSTYAERRAEISKAAATLLDKLDDLERSGKVDDWGGGPSEWAQLEERLAGLRDEMDNATTLDHFQDVGRRGREILIDVVALMFAVDMVQDNQEQPTAGDAKARFDLVVEAYAPGSSSEELRGMMRAAWRLTNHVTHAASVTRVDAFSAAQATVLIVRTLSEMHNAGRLQH